MIRFDRDGEGAPAKQGEDMDRPHARNLRCGRFSESGRIYHIATATADRRPLFAEFYTARDAIMVLRETQGRSQATTLAFVLMPDHLHWLLQLGERSSLSQVVGTFKSLSSRRIGESVWQKGFFDYAIRQDEDLPAIARYIIANPLRAGLVDKIGDYPHWDAVWL